MRQKCRTVSNSITSPRRSTVFRTIGYPQDYFKRNKPRCCSIRVKRRKGIYLHRETNARWRRKKKREVQGKKRKNDEVRLIFVDTNRRTLRSDERRDKRQRYIEILVLIDTKRDIVPQVSRSHFPHSSSSLFLPPICAIVRLSRFKRGKCKSGYRRTDSNLNEAQK